MIQIWSPFHNPRSNGPFPSCCVLAKYKKNLQEIQHQKWPPDVHPARRGGERVLPGGGRVQGRQPQERRRLRICGLRGKSWSVVTICDYCSSFFISGHLQPEYGHQFWYRAFQIFCRSKVLSRCLKQLKPPVYFITKVPFLPGLVPWPVSTNCFQNEKFHQVMENWSCRS